MKNKLSLGVLLLLSIGILWGFVTVNTGKTAEIDGQGASNNQDNQAMSEEAILEGDELMISEIIPKNSSLYHDSLGNYVDLIELYNPTDEVINLKDYGLSDEPSVPHKWQFGNLSIQPKSYMIIFANPLDTLVDLSNSAHEDIADYYTNFKLDAKGERLALSDPKGNILDIYSYDRLDSNMSYGRLVDQTYAYFMQGTPGTENSGIHVFDIMDYYAKVTIKPLTMPGIFTESFDLGFEIEETSSEYELRYTLDGNDPTSQSNLYEQPIQIEDGNLSTLRYANIAATFYGSQQVNKKDVNRGTVVKAQYFNEELPVGEMFVGTYFVWGEGSNRYSMDIVSLTSDSKNLFDDATGIYVVGSAFEEIAPQNPDGSTPANYNQRGREWEREAHIEFFNTAGSQVYQQNIGMRTLGGWSRANAKKSFRLIARSEYDDASSFDYPIFDNLSYAEGDTIQEFQTILLRSGGNDWEYTLFRDVLTDELVRGMLDFQEYKPVVVFLNGEYWGIYDIREHMDEDYIASHYGLNPDEVSIIAYNPSGIELYAGEEKALTEYNQFLAEVDTMDLSLTENYEKIKQKVDIQNFVDYYISQIYVNNADWPGNNSKIWFYSGKDIDLEDPIKDGRFRFLLFDTEFNFGLYEGSNAASKDSFKLLSDGNSENWPNPSWSTVLYRKCMENKEFRDTFMKRMADLLNSRFDKMEVYRTINELIGVYEPEMDEYIKRWNFWAMKNASDWKNNQVSSLFEFASKRNNFLFSAAVNNFKLEGVTTIKVMNVEGVNIRVNDDYDVPFKDAKNEETESQTLTYFKDFPVTIEATIGEDVQFLGWEFECNEGEWSDYIIEGDLSSPKITFKPSTKITLTPKISTP